MTTTIEQLPRMASVREVTMELLRDLGMTTIFGNPGSTELKFMKNWPDDFRYVMGLHEGCSVGMADAYAQVTGNAAFVNLHSAGGVGNAMGLLYTAFRNQAPLVVIAGQQTRAMLPTEPFLFAQDATTLPRPYVKWSIEPARAQDVPAAIARAYYIAMLRPLGPAFVSVPEDDWDAPINALAVRKLYPDFRPDPAAIDALAAAFRASRAPAIVVGSGVDRDGAVDAVVRLAERTSAMVWASALASRCNFPETHPLFAGALPRIRTGVVDRLRDTDLVVVLGAPVFNYHIHAEGPFIAPGTTVFQLTDDPNTASFAAVGTSIITTIAPAVEQLLALLPASAAPPRATPAPRARPKVAASDPMSVEYVLQSIGETMPADAIIAEEAPATHTVLHDYLPIRAGAFFTAASGSLGYGLPAAIGVALAEPGRRVIALLGDGSSYYSIQALWTAAQQRLPITFLIVNNGGYGAMRSFSKLLKSDRSPSFDIDGIDFASIAKGFGCAAMRAARADELVPVLEQSYRSDGPVVVDILIDSAIKPLT